VKVSIKENKSWFASGSKVLFDLEGDLTPGEQSRFVDFCLVELIPLEIYQSQTVRNLKGRDADNVLIEDLPANFRPDKEELVYLAGQLGGKDIEKKDRFEVAISSPFKAFDDSSAILHGIDSKVLGLPKWLKSKLLARTLPLKIEVFRLALERFEIRKKMASTRATPEVSERLLVDCFNLKLRLRWSSEQSEEPVLFKKELGSVLEYLKGRGHPEPASRYQQQFLN